VQEPLSINIFSTSDDAGTSTTGLNGQFVYSQLLIDCLLRMKTNETDNNKLISLCEKEYEGNNGQLSIVREFQRDYSPDKVLWWYSRESFFYKILNKALRSQNIDVLFLFRSFISDIHRQLQHHKCKRPIRVYRSQLMSSDELANLKQYIGQFIFVNSFFSTSTQRQVAMFYMNDGTSLDALQRVLFEIDASPDVVTTKPFANISSQSEYDSESEVLFMFGSIFRLNDISCDDNQVWIIRMSMCGDEEHDLKQVLVHMKQQNGTGDANLWTFGKILWRMGKFDLAEKYFCRLLYELPMNDPSRGILYENLSEMASQQGDYDKSIQWHKKSMKIEEETVSTDNTNLGATSNTLGKFHQKKRALFFCNVNGAW
jgi:tetratricopeptide (TPR) repeat protein